MRAFVWLFFVTCAVFVTFLKYDQLSLYSIRLRLIFFLVAVASVVVVVVVVVVVIKNLFITFRS